MDTFGLGVWLGEFGLDMEEVAENAVELAGFGEEGVVADGGDDLVHADDVA